MEPQRDLSNKTAASSPECSPRKEPKYDSSSPQRSSGVADDGGRLSAAVVYYVAEDTGSDAESISGIYDPDTQHREQGYKYIKIIEAPTPNRAPATVLSKLINSALFEELVRNPSFPVKPLHIEIMSLGPRQGNNVWKLHFLQVSGKQRGQRHSAFVCNNPKLPECGSVMGTASGMTHHQATAGHADNIRCDVCGTSFNTGRMDVLLRHQGDSCARQLAKQAKRKERKFVDGTPKEKPAKKRKIE